MFDNNLGRISNDLAFVPLFLEDLEFLPDIPYTSFINCNQFV